jgi:hypothetical protein
MTHDHGDGLRCWLCYDGCAGGLDETCLMAGDWCVTHEKFETQHPHSHRQAR